MSEAPLAPKCRHCDATNDSGASECWLCHRRDWREVPAIGPGKSWSGPRENPRAIFTGLLVVVTLALAGCVAMAFEAGRIVGVIVLVVAVLIFALAILLFTICTAMA